MLNKIYKLKIRFMSLGNLIKEIDKYTKMVDDKNLSGKDLRKAFSRLLDIMVELVRREKNVEVRNNMIKNFKKLVDEFTD